MAPFLIFGFFVAGVLSVLIQPEVVERHLGGRGLWQVIKAAIFGVPLPLCSCGVIPVAASLRRHGAGSGATTSFLISTPQTGVDSIMVTLSLLGPVFAVFRPLISFVSGLLGGSLVTYFGSSAGSREEPRPKCVEECCTGVEIQGKIPRVLRYGFITLPRDINKALIIGVLVAGAISALVPDDYFSWILGGGIVSMLVMMAVGIPIYVCATASVPVAAALIAKGVSPGAALVFLMTGPATNAATVTTVWKIMGKRTAGIYLGTVAVSSVAAGLFLDYIFEAGALPVASGMPWMVPGYVKTISAGALLAIMVAAFFRPSKVGEKPMTKEAGQTLKLTIEGMSCDHCARSIQRALVESPGVQSAVVDLKSGEALVTGEDLDTAVLSEAIEELGYKVVDSDFLEE
ncbi:hypothetical protein AMJ82_09695 [candidate division TA06 bacterium SM23_40]|uniref:HMA domain-containing protein n=1 Tax=candidate division TA06 bacterium SM23_40 TaxID=1703774 RepID=A0A0S8G4E6_UNCT6|nr:MAG: hypothetical protein AMJ82_09695 [candidate division TA06 bacterium SM23_40]